MEKKFTFFRQFFAFAIFTSIILVANLFTGITYAQASCENSTSLFKENFGTGTVATSHPDIIPGSLTYQETGSLVSEGIYRIINKTQQKSEWQISDDHTPADVNGKMLVANGNAEMFYSHTITTSAGFEQGNYSLSAYAMNVDTPGTCTYPLLTTFTYTVEYMDASNAWAPLSGSPYVASPLAQVSPAQWIAQGALFTLPSTGNFRVSSIRIRISDGVKGGCGNDFALDDISFSQCPVGGPTPVEFLDITARQKGSGVSVDWSTSQEFNSDYFDLEKSVDGNYNWSYVNTVKGAGNSSVVKKYNIYDSKPFAGYSFYRLKQVDKDGKFKYSKTVRININIAKVGVSVLTNPFRNRLSVDFLSAKDEVLNARLIDITGKLAASEKWSITSGSTRKEFTNISNLQQGMYILTISNAAGEVLYNNKVIKQ